MREILFRGKRKDNGEWVMGNLFVPDNPETPTQICIGTNIVRISYDIDPKTIGQYTGLKDKNDKKIFEGDILNVRSYDYNYEYSTKVFYNSHTLCVDVYGQDYDYTAIGFAYDVWDDENCEIEIIGNIHDNPELLKGGEDNDLQRLCAL